jgi:hypothetical protein
MQHENEGIERPCGGSAYPAREAGHQS